MPLRKTLLAASLISFTALSSSALAAKATSANNISINYVSGNLACLGVSALVIDGSSIPDIQDWLASHGGSKDPYTGNYGVCLPAQGGQKLNLQLPKHGDKISLVGASNSPYVIIANVGDPGTGSDVITATASGAPFSVSPAQGSGDQPITFSVSHEPS